MKKLFYLPTAIILFMFIFLPSPYGDAQNVPSALPVGQISELFDGQSIDLDGDGRAEKIGFRFESDDDTGTSAFVLSVADAQISGSGDAMTGRLHAMPLPSTGEALLFLSDYGPSDDDTSHVFVYSQDCLRAIGTIGTMPWDLAVSGANTLSGVRRASVLCTWKRECDYVICTSFDAENGQMHAVALHEMPRSEYAAGMQATLLRALPLQRSRTDDTVTCTLSAGSSVCIVATDDIEWIYIVSSDGCEAGWLCLNADDFGCTLDGETVFTYDIFDGLLYAD